MTPLSCHLRILTSALPPLRCGAEWSHLRGLTVETPFHLFHLGGGTVILRILGGLGYYLIGNQPCPVFFYVTSSQFFFWVPGYKSVYFFRWIFFLIWQEAKYTHETRLTLSSFSELCIWMWYLVHDFWSVSVGQLHEVRMFLLRISWVGILLWHFIPRT